MSYQKQNVLEKKEHSKAYVKQMEMTKQLYREQGLAITAPSESVEEQRRLRYKYLRQIKMIYGASRGV